MNNYKSLPTLVQCLFIALVGLIPLSCSADSKYVNGVGLTTFLGESQANNYEKQCLDKAIRRVVDKIQLNEFDTSPLIVHQDHALAKHHDRLNTIIVYWELRDWKIHIYPANQQEIMIQDRNIDRFAVVKLRNHVVDLDRCKVNQQITKVL